MPAREGPGARATATAVGRSDRPSPRDAMIAAAPNPPGASITEERTSADAPKGEGAVRREQGLRRALVTPPTPTVLLVHLASLVAALFVLIAVNRHGWFILDEWEMIVRSTHPLSLHILFYPHNEHWSTLPVLEYRLLLSIFGLRTYWPYLAVLFAVHLLLAHLLWRLCRQVGVNDWVATGLAAVFAVLGAGGENLVNAFQVSFVASVCAGVGAVLLVNDVDRRNRSRDTAAVALMMIALLSSGVGVAMVLMVGMVALFRGSLRWAARLVALPAVAYGLWYLLIGHRGLSADSLTLGTLLELPRFLWTGTTSALSSAVGVPGSGGTIVLVLIAYLVLRGKQFPTREAPALAGVITSFVFMLVTGVGRVRLGIEESTAPRYAYVVVALIVPAAGVLVTYVVDRARGVRLVSVVAVCLLVLVAANNIGLLRTQADQLAVAVRTSRRQVLAAAALVRSGQPVVEAQVSLPYDPDIDTTALRSFIRKDYFSSAVPVTKTGHADAQTALQVSLSSGPWLDDSGTGAQVVAARDLTVRALHAPCLLVTPSSRQPLIVIKVSSPSSIAVDTAGSSVITVGLQDLSPGSPVGGPKALALPGGRTAFLNVLARDVNAYLALPNAPARLCGVRGPPS
jgi:hypothetical protein